MCSSPYCFLDSIAQSIMFLLHLSSNVTARGHTLIDRELYLPLDWTEDPARCRAAGIPETMRFQTKPEQAVQMLARVWHAQIPIAWVVADTVYGGNLDLRTWLKAHAYHMCWPWPMNRWD